MDIIDNKKTKLQSKKHEEEDDEESFDMNEFEKFNDELEPIEDEEYEDEDEEIEEIRDEEQIKNLLKKKKKKADDVSEIDDEEVEDAVFAREHGYSLNKEASSKIKNKSEFFNKNLIDEIEDLENNMIGKKSWQLRGEISAKNRPKESLLQEHLDFKVSARPKPIPSSEKNALIEKMIKIRIANDLYDDPKRTVIKTKGGKDQFELKFDKSAKGLAELYEEDLFGADNVTEVKSHDKIEIENMMEELFTMFHGLTNNTFVGERIKNDMNVVKNIKAIRLEEVSKFVPNNTKAVKHINSESDKLDKAVSEYNPKKVESAIKDELSQEELKKKHRQMKRKVHKKIYEGNLKKKMNSLSKDYDSKFEVRLAMQKSKDKQEKSNVKSKELKSSKFFNNLQTNNQEEKNSKEKKEKIKSSK